MLRVTKTVGLAAGIALLATAVFVPSAFAGYGHSAPACKSHASSKKVCFPKQIAGSFSGSNNQWSWSGTASMKRHKMQTVYNYTGSATFNWNFKPTEDTGCVPTPSSGTVTKPVGLSVNLIRNPGEGWNYIASDDEGIHLGNISWDCGNGPNPPGDELVVGAFDFGGRSKKLHGYTSSQGGMTIASTSKWTLYGSN